MLNPLTLYGMYCLSNCVPTYPQLRPDVMPTASGRTTRCVATQFGGASGALLLPVVDI